VKRAAASLPTLRRPQISPHTLRHTKAMHLLQAGIPLVTIKDILGHADVKSTEVYVQTDVETKPKALARAGTPTCTAKRPRLPNDLLAWLEAL
jgi:integrase/recombinase XerD